MTRTIFMRPSWHAPARAFCVASVAIALTICAGGASAQAQVFQPVVTISTLLLNTLTAITLVVGTIAVCIAGWKILFQGASFRDVSNLLIGGAVSGGAGTIAALF